MKNACSQIYLEPKLYPLSKGEILYQSKPANATTLGHPKMYFHLCHIRIRQGPKHPHKYRPLNLFNYHNLPNCNNLTKSYC